MIAVIPLLFGRATGVRTLGMGSSSGGKSLSIGVAVRGGGERLVRGGTAVKGWKSAGDRGAIGALEVEGTTEDVICAVGSRSNTDDDANGAGAEISGDLKSKNDVTASVAGSEVLLGSRSNIDDAAYGPNAGMAGGSDRSNNDITSAF